MTTAAEIEFVKNQGLYDSAYEHDACGVGFVAHIRGEKSHSIVKNALKILENLDHRGAVGADKLMGDGAGILVQLPDALYRQEMAAQGGAPWAKRRRQDKVEVCRPPTYRIDRSLELPGNLAGWLSRGDQATELSVILLAPCPAAA